MDNINKKERLERRSSISLYFKLDLQLFAETPSGDPNLPDYKSEDPFMNNDDIPLSNDSNRRSNPYNIEHIDKRYKAWATYMLSIKYESLDDWCAIHGVHYDNNVKVWPDGIGFTESSVTNSVPSDEDKERIRHYFDSVVHATSMNRFVKSNYPGLGNSTLMNDASLLKIVPNIDFSKCTSGVEMFRYDRGLSYPIFRNNTFSPSTPIDMTRAFADCFRIETFEFDTGGTLYFSEHGFDEIFLNCSQLVLVGLSKVNMSRVERLSDSFKGCTNLENIVGTLDLSSLRYDEDTFNNHKAFKDCTKIKNPINVYIRDIFVERSFPMELMTANGGFKRTLAKYLGLEENKLNLTTGYDIL
jgi:hypothetical protein